MTTAMKTATTVRALNRVATALLVHRKRPSLKARIPVRVRLLPDAMTVARAHLHLSIRKATMTTTVNRRVILKKIFSRVPMLT